MIDAIVTGANGFIGKALCKRLEAQGLSVLRLGRKEGCVSEGSTWNALPVARTVFHLAGRSFVPQSWVESVDFMRINVLGTEQALDYCRKSGASLVFASAYVYGIPDKLPIAESDAARPNNPYALSKLLAEQLCEFSSTIHNVTTSVLRIFNVFGPGQRPEFLIPSIINQVFSSDRVSVQDLTPRRDYIFIDDVVDAFIKAGELTSGFRRLNIGSGVSHSVEDVIECVQAAAGTRLPIVSNAIERKQEIPDVQADTVLSLAELGWQPTTSLRDGILKIITRSEN